MSLELCTLFQKLLQKVVKKKFECESILCNSTEQRFDWTSREIQNQTIVFSRNFWYNIILKLLSILYMYKLNDVYWNNKIKMSTWNALCMHNFNVR